jgi:hypothetical protein
MHHTITFPNTTLDPRLIRYDVFLVDLSAIAGTCFVRDRDGKDRIRDIRDRIPLVRDNPRRLKEMTRNGIDQLLTIEDFLGRSPVVIAPGQEEELRTQLDYDRRVRAQQPNLPEQQYGAVQFATHETLTALPKRDHPARPIFTDIAYRTRRLIEKDGRASWMANRSSDAPSGVDIDIIATAAAHAYSGVAACIISNDSGLLSVARWLTVLAGEPPAPLGSYRSVLADLNGIADRYEADETRLA